jgi:surface antigen Omp85-like protein
MSPARAITLAVLCLAACPASAAAQAQEPSTRAGQIEQAQAAKVTHPYEPGQVEKVLDFVESTLVPGSGPHPFFESAYSGGGFTLGAGYNQFVSPYNSVDVRGSYTFKNYKRIEAEFTAPGLFDGRGTFSALAGWREATQVGFYGIGTNTSKGDRVNYGFTRPYASAQMVLRPTGGGLVLSGGAEVSQWDTGPGDGSVPSIETVYTPQSLPGLGAEPVYYHTQATVGFDSRPAVDYARHGGYYRVTFHDYADPDDVFGLNQITYEAMQHIPILRETWVVSMRARVETATNKEGQELPYFMLPSLGGGSSLRGFSSWRFRDRNSLLLQLDWRTMVNRYIDIALLYDAGKVTGRSGDLSLNGLKSDFGVGFRLHGPTTTPLRIDIMKANEGFHIVFASGAAF